MWKRNMNAEETAQVIERFLDSRSLYPQEWNDFVETPQWDKTIEHYRQQCHQLDPLVNRPGSPDATAIAKLKSIIGQLRLNES